MTKKLVAKRKPRSAPITKAQTCIGLLSRKHGATLAELMTATGWQAHSIRGFLSGTIKKKRGLALASASDKVGNRRYRLLSDRESTQ